MAGTASDLRRNAEAALKEAKKADPEMKNDATKILAANVAAAKSVEDSATGSNGQARSFF